MSRTGSRRAAILALGLELAHARGWPVAASPRSRHLRLNATTRLALQSRGLVVIATATFVLDPDAVINTPEDLARALGAALADTALAVARPRID